MATYLNFPFDPELFLYNWQNENDPTLTAMLDSGAVREDATIRGLIQNGSDNYTIPFYKVIGGTPENYDGATDITLTETEGGSQSGIVYGRAHAWSARDFIIDYNSGADPMKQITSQVAKYWAKQKQNRLINIAEAVFGVTGSGDLAGWANHVSDITASGADISNTSGKIAATTIGEAIQKAVGDAADAFGLAVMHSKVATNLAGLEILEYRKYTDAQGIQRQMKIADINGMTVVVDDGVPVTGSGASTKYTSYLFGNGAFLTAPANCDKPVENGRDPLKYGGLEYLVTRLRETIHPNGFTFTKPAEGYTASPSEAQLAATANWSIVGNPKNIAMVKLVSKG